MLMQNQIVIHVIKQITIIQLIPITKHPVFLLLVNYAILLYQAGNQRRILSMMLSFFQFIPEAIKESGLLAASVTQIQRIISYSIARDVMPTPIRAKTILMRNATPVIPEELANEKNQEMRTVVLILFVITLSAGINGQTTSVNLTGKVSFVSPSNVYVKFTSTQGIAAGDTLFTFTGGKLVPGLKVTNLSSTSCVCSLISNDQIAMGDQFIARVNVDSVKKQEKPVENAVNQTIVQTLPDSTATKTSSAGEYKQKVRGSLSAFSYSDFSNTPAPSSTRLRYNFSLDARNISDSKFSVESYLSFTHKIGDWAAVKSDPLSALKIYSLALRYDINNTTHFSIGRRINEKLSNIGAMDGLQIEKTINKLSLGVLAGTRPDYTNYGFNINLLQYGAYVSAGTLSADKYNETSLAFMQQTNNGKTDRRFIYFQHSNSLVKNLFFLGTFEVDLYKLTIDSLNNEHPSNTFNPTGLYLSLRYRLAGSLTISGSYDARKNVIYYETYKSYIDRILDSEIRQGFRLQANYSITHNIVMGVQAGYRYLKSDPHPSRNLYGYFTYSQIPGVNISATLSATYLESGYMNGNLYGLTLYRDFFNGKLQSGLGYRYIDYKLPENNLSVPQNIAEMNLSWQFARGLSFAVNYEGTFEQVNKYNRIYLQLRKRF
jgi:hypothetical protein